MIGVIGTSVMSVAGAVGAAGVVDLAGFAGAALLGYRPLLEPLPVGPYWLWLLPPLAVVVAVVYKAIKLEDLAALPRQAAFLALQIIVFMVLAAAALWVIVEVV